VLGRRYGSRYELQVVRRWVKVYQEMRARLAVLVSEEPIAQGQF
jgi:ribosomal protein L37AE/L43A